ncbi:4-(cytidine 5'-diphospho)-2-C-methyl-D-erythritol kinase [Thermobrachium celere]|uniref:4-diphosphocytidyl-2-C-methyl-D-erythritol kinase n=1 Tax=Thermobrachium celere DSM 8682 TaxID=941824 RepID=R7RM37_9CLOT|nr:4-(cytidine 5'-diphospho)-2-C-methyl-D-erythritol kinase [Thermobrachium celere]CDF57232.1 4-diphosphocytidyl-2-C-methyl-D-erythritol kinase [Thermobrachium celere DSM 8682]
MIIECPAKINLSLDVVGKREDGYHLLQMIMQTIALYDRVKITKNNEMVITCNKIDVPCDRSNIAYRAVEVMKEKFNIEDNFKIEIEKNIPVAAGLAGGSTNAAAVIKGLNDMYSLNLSIDQMKEIGLKLGADVPFFFEGGTCLAEGIGEKLTKLNDVSCHLVVAKPPINVSTKYVYQNLKLDEIAVHPDTKRIIQYINSNDIRSLAESMVNVLETVTVREYPVIFEIKNIMMEFGALGSLMSGSGPSVFGIFEDKADALKCHNRLRDYIKEVFVVSTINRGV